MESQAIISGSQAAAFSLNLLLLLLWGLGGPLDINLGLCAYKACTLPMSYILGLLLKKIFLKTC